MKLKNLIASSIVLYVVYKIGKIAGCCKCLRNVADKYGEKIEDERIECQLGRKSSVSIRNCGKKENAEKGE